MGTGAKNSRRVRRFSVQKAQYRANYSRKSYRLWRITVSNYANTCLFKQIEHTFVNEYHLQYLLIHTTLYSGRDGGSLLESISGQKVKIYLKTLTDFNRPKG